MTFVLCFVLTAALSILLRRPLHKTPIPFYAVAILFDVVLLFQNQLGLPRETLSIISLLMQRGNLGMAFFAVVMLIGVFPRKGKVSLWLRPVRAELSILACILISGHMLVYLNAYLPRIVNGDVVKGNVMAAFVIAVVLLALVVVLGVTSFRFVKRHMKARNWKKLQSLSYLFYLLVYVHLMFMLVPSAMRGAQTALSMAIVYSILFVAYFVARVIRARVDNAEKVDLAETVKDQGFIE